MRRLSNLGRGLLHAAFGTGLLLALANVALTAVHGETNKPIIAYLMAEPEAYEGKSIVIYGLVIKTANAGKVFWLQDVSQMPLKIIRKDGLPTLVGDQVLVHGVFSAKGGNPRLDASKIIETKVLGGGGCC